MAPARVRRPRTGRRAPRDDRARARGWPRSSAPDHDRIWRAFVEHGVTPVFHVADQRRVFDDVWYSVPDDGGLRLVLAIPALALAAALGGGFASGSESQGSWSASQGGDNARWWTFSSVGGVAAAAAFLAWFAILARGRAPRGLRDLVAFALGYGAQAGGYLLLLTPRYPTSDPALAEEYSDLPQHPVRIVVDDDLARPRLTVLFRLFLAIPHFVWLACGGSRHSSPSSPPGSRRSRRGGFQVDFSASSRPTSGTRRTSSPSCTSSAVASPASRDVLGTGSTSRSIQR